MLVFVDKWYSLIFVINDVLLGSFDSNHTKSMTDSICFDKLGLNCDKIV